MRRLIPILLSVILLLLVSACSLLEETAEEADVVETPALPTPADTPGLETTPEAIAPTPAAPTTITVTVWTTPDLAPGGEVPGGPTLMEQLNAFDNSHPDANLLVELKSITGQGGALSYLRTGRNVAPAILPDLILLPDTQLAEAVAQDLVYPLNNLLAPEMFEDLYPAARELAQVEDQYYGYPFALTNLRHFVYQPAVITGTLPTTWPGLLAQEDPPSLIYPAAGPAGAAFTLHYYLAAGGTLRNEADQPALQVEPLTIALTQIQQGLATGVIDPQSGNTATVEQAWQIFQNSSTSLVGTDAGYFLRQRGVETDGTYAFTPLPGPEGPLPPLVNGLTWAVSTPDPARQALAAELIAWLGASQNLGEWSRQSFLLPARSSALAVWPQEDRYVDFLEERLLVARPFPASANSSITLALSEATTGVILQLNTPQAAAEEAVASLNPDT